MNRSVSGRPPDRHRTAPRAVISSPERSLITASKKSPTASPRAIQPAARTSRVIPPCAAVRASGGRRDQRHTKRPSAANSPAPAAHRGVATTCRGTARPPATAEAATRAALPEGVAAVMTSVPAFTSSTRLRFLCPHNVSFQPRPLTIALPAAGCKRWLGGQSEKPRGRTAPARAHNA
jgi:hypothetical protein